LRRSGLLIATPVVLGLILVLAGCVQGRPTALPAVAVLPSRTGQSGTFSEWLDEKQVEKMTASEWAAIARRNSVVVLNSWDFRLIPILKRANPEVKVWVYKDLSGIRSDDCTTRQGTCGDCGPGITDSSFLSSGMGYCSTIRGHVGWLLRSAQTGRPFQFRSYPNIWATDYGNSSYQHLWIQNVLADVRAHGWNGVAVDNALTTANAYGMAANYRSDSSVQAATFSALETIGKAFREAGVASVVNVGYATRFSGLWQRWLRPVGGLEQEFYLARPGGPSATGAAWRKYEREVASCAAEHKSCWFKPGGAALSGAGRYALASYLIAADGRRVIGAQDAAPAGRPCWQLGPPEGPRALLGLAWRRVFKHGVAIVNPTGESLTVPTGGRYPDRNGHNVNAITLQPASAAVLRAVPSATAGMAQRAQPSYAIC
jgi:Hypothetical glycosyl hydrolase family 15